MVESVTLTAPARVSPGTPSWEPILLHLNWEDATVKIGFRGQNGEFESFSYEDAEATTLLRALNKADLTVTSLHKRVMEKVIADGKLAGTISGAPD